MLPIPKLADVTVANLTYLSEAAAEATRQHSSDRLLGRYTKLKSGLTSRLGLEALAEFEKRYSAPEAQAALRQQLKTLLAEDPAFWAELDGLLEEVSPWM